MDALDLAQESLAIAKRLVDEDDSEAAIRGALRVADVAANVAIAEALDRIAMKMPDRL